MDDLKISVDALVNEFVNRQRFPNTSAMMTYIANLKLFHQEDDCIECTSKDIKNNIIGKDANDNSPYPRKCITVPENKNISQGILNESSFNSLGKAISTDTNKSKLRRHSRKSVCVIPKLTYSSESDISDADNNHDGGDEDDDDDDDDEEDDEVWINDKLQAIDISNDHEVEAKEQIVIDHNPVANISPNESTSSDSDGSPILTKKKKTACKIHSGSSSDEAIDNKTKTFDDAKNDNNSSSTDDTDVENSIMSEEEDIFDDNDESRSEDQVFRSSINSNSSDDFDNYNNFLSTCKDSKKSGNNRQNLSSGSDDSYDSDSFIVKDTEYIKSTSRKKIPLHNKVINHTTPKSSITNALDKIQTPMSVPGTPAFKREFNKTRDNIVQGLFKLYNETVFDNKLPNDFQITWNKRMTKTAGFCYLTRKSDIRSARIELSDKVIDTVERIRDTLIHELCHAVTWIFDEKRGHGLAWKYWAKKANKIHPDLPVVTTCHNYEIQTKFKYQCDACGQTFGRHTKSIDESKHTCRCGGRPVLITNNPSASGVPRKPNPYTAYVKENFGSVKKNHPHFSHKEIMQTIAADFRKCKITEDKENINNIEEI